MKPNKQQAKANPRLLAITTLKKIITRKNSLDRQLHAQTLSEDIRPLVYELVYGVLRYYYSLDSLLQKYMHTKLRKKDTDIYCILLIGAYQLKYMRTPAYAAVNECVALSQSVKKTWAKPMVNAILRNISREAQDNNQDRQELQELQEFSEPACFDHPQWMIDHIKAAYPLQWREILKINNTRAPLTLRVNLRLNARKMYQTLLAKAEIEAQPCSINSAINLKAAIETKTLPGWQEGLISAQDEGAQQLSELVSLPPGTRVLDACAAPGGKSLLLLEQNPEIILTSLDIDAERLSHLSEETQRLGLPTPNIISGDATQLDWWDNKHAFDYIILDAPCSGSGTIRRHPDIKLLKLEEDIQKFAVLQLQLLENLWSILTEGGTLLYATCSILPEENDLVIERFLAGKLKAHLLPVKLHSGKKTKCGYQLLPQQDGHDGFYFSLISKQNL